MMGSRAVRAAIVGAFRNPTGFAVALGMDESRNSWIPRGRRRLTRKRATRWPEVLSSDLDRLSPLLRAR